MMGEYALADETYAELLDKLAGHDFSGLSAALQADIVRFYASAGSDPLSQKDKKRWERTRRELDRLKNAKAANDAPPGDASAALLSG